MPQTLFGGVYVRIQVRIHRCFLNPYRSKGYADIIHLVAPLLREDR